MEGEAGVNQTTAMSHNDDATANTVNEQLLFSKKLQTLTNKIHATSNIDEIMLDLSQDMCNLFACDRLTIYAVTEDKTNIQSKVKTGMSSFKDFALPISEKSIAGYVALFKKMVNVRNVYDEQELLAYSSRLEFVKKVDERTGYVTRQNLAAPIVNADTNEVLGVVQLINTWSGEAFSALVEAGVQELCATLAIAFDQRLKPAVLIRSKYDPLVAHAILSAPELALAIRSARRKGADIEEVLISEFQVKRSDIGAALAQHYGIPYEPYRDARIKPANALTHFDRADADFMRWLPLEHNEQGLLVVTTDPALIMSSGRVEEFFPDLKISYRVTTNAEFDQTIDLFFGGVDEPGLAENSKWGFDSMDNCAATESALSNRVHAGILDAFKQEDLADIGIVLRPGADKLVSRFHKDGSLESIRGSLTVNYQVDFPHD